METASAVARHVVKALESGSAVANPDHPYLLAAPDLLATDDRGLVAVFIQHASEARTAARLESRMLLSALAFPSHTKFVVVQRREHAGIDAADVVVEDRPEEIARAIQRAPRRGDPTSRSVRAVAAGRAQRAAKDSAPGNAVSGMYDAILRRRRRSLDMWDGRLVSSVGDLTPGGAVSRLRELLLASVAAEYGFDNGAVHPRSNELPVHLVYGGESLLRSRSFDPYKPLRAAAFAGWHVSGVRDEGDYWPDELDGEAGTDE